METSVIRLSCGVQTGFFFFFPAVINIMGKQIIGFVGKNKGKYFIFLTKT